MIPAPGSRVVLAHELRRGDLLVTVDRPGGNVDAVPGRGERERVVDAVPFREQGHDGHELVRLVTEPATEDGGWAAGPLCTSVVHARSKVVIAPPLLQVMRARVVALAVFLSVLGVGVATVALVKAW